jgi:lipopolysaccharide/colanic/teichoic acid biosynthesis glycosyltransferase
MKRIFDITLSFTLLFLLLPLWLLAIIIIFISDPGPIFFRQSRVGKNEKEFFILKFRTMFFYKELANTTTLKHDPRVFKGGYFLRKYKIDEIPQILNVLDGSMSLVGPRPTVSSDAQKMNTEQRRRFSVRPGLTGLAQICGNTSLKWNKRIEYDLHYIDHWSIWSDIVILAKTGLLVIVGRADTHPASESEWD